MRGSFYFYQEKLIKWHQLLVVLIRLRFCKQEQYSIECQKQSWIALVSLDFVLRLVQKTSAIRLSTN